MLCVSPSLELRNLRRRCQGFLSKVIFLILFEEIVYYLSSLSIYMRVEEIMTTPVVFTQQTVKVGHLKDMFTRKNINAVPVIEDDGSISGIVSSSDLVACHDDSLLVGDVMSPRVHIGVRHNRVKDAAKVMLKYGVHHLVVMDDGDVVGMISSMDVIKVYAEQ